MSSVWPPALASLDESLAVPCESVGELEAVQLVDLDTIIKQLEQAANAAQELRSLVSSVLPEASWQTREELDAVVAEVQRIVGGRSRLLALAAELEHGCIVHRRALRVDQLNQLRAQAVVELRTHAQSAGGVPSLPGPEADDWIEWACSLQEPEDAAALRSLRSGFPRLDDFVADLEPGMWIPKKGALSANGVELGKLIEEVREQLRSRLVALAAELERGSIVHHRALRVSQLNQLREAAVSELRALAGSGGEPPTLPGPPAERWVAWACGLQEPEDIESLQTLREGFARLDDFIASLEPEMWRAGGAAAEVLPKADKSAAPTQPVQSQQDTKKIAKPEAPSRPAPVELKTAESSVVGDKAGVSGSVGRPSASMPQPAKVTPQPVKVTPEPAKVKAEPAKVKQEPAKVKAEPAEVKPEPAKVTPEPARVTSDFAAPKRAKNETESSLAKTRKQLADLAASVKERARHFQQSAKSASSADGSREPGVATAGTFAIKTTLEKRFGKNWWLPVAIAAVLVFALVGTIVWRSQRKQSVSAAVNTTDSTAANNLAAGNPGNLVTNPAAVPANPGPGTTSPTAKNEKQPQPQATPAPTTQASNSNNGTLATSVMTVPNDLSQPKQPKTPPNGAADTPDPTPPSIPGGVPNTVASIVKDVPATQPKLAPPQPRVIASGEQGLVIHRVAPLYPAQARSAHIQGTVVLQAVIGKDGSVLNVEVVSGNPVLRQAAVAAVKQWRFNPYFRNGEPVEAQTEVKVTFAL